MNIPNQPVPVRKLKYDACFSVRNLTWYCLAVLFLIIFQLYSERKYEKTTCVQTCWLVFFKTRGGLMCLPRLSRVIMLCGVTWCVEHGGGTWDACEVLTYHQPVTVSVPLLGWWSGKVLPLASGTLSVVITAWLVLCVSPWVKGVRVSLCFCNINTCQRGEVEGTCSW